MNTQLLPGFSCSHATLDTLVDLYALHTNAPEVKRLSERLSERVLTGHVDLSKSLLLRSARGIEAVVLLVNNPSVPACPRYRPDLPAEVLIHFFERMREMMSVTPERLLVLDETLVLPRLAEATAAGWILDNLATSSNQVSHLYFKQN